MQVRIQHGFNLDSKQCVRMKQQMSNFSPVFPILRQCDGKIFTSIKVAVVFSFHCILLFHNTYSQTLAEISQIHGLGELVLPFLLFLFCIFLVSHMWILISGVSSHHSNKKEDRKFYLDICVLTPKQNPQFMNLLPTLVVCTTVLLLKIRKSFPSVLTTTLLS